MPLLLLLAFIAVPVVEIAVIIRVGGLIGLWPTVGLIILTAVAGTVLVRAQGFVVLQRIRANLEEGVFPAQALFDGFALLVAGLMLLTPGFITDAVGLVLLIPPARRAIGRTLWGWFTRGGEVRVRRRYHRGGGDVIDAEFHEIPQERLERTRRDPNDDPNDDEDRRRR